MKYLPVEARSAALKVLNVSDEAFSVEPALCWEDGSSRRAWQVIGIAWLKAHSPMHWVSQEAGVFYAAI